MSWDLGEVDASVGPSILLELAASPRARKRWTPTGHPGCSGALQPKPSGCATHGGSCYAAGVWPRVLPWTELEFGVEVEFVDADPDSVRLVPGWTMDRGDSQLALTGARSGAEAKPGKLGWAQRGEIDQILAAIEAAGGAVNWSCGFHVHVGLEPWGESILEPLLDATLTTQGALAELFMLPPHRQLFAPELSEAMCEAWRANPDEDALNHVGRPQSHRCGVNVAAWYEHRSVEFRFPNATLDGDEARRSVELCLRWVAAVGEGRELPSEMRALAKALEVPAEGYPAPHPEPPWHRREEQLNELLIPVLQPMIEREVPGAEILFIRATPEGLTAKTDRGGRHNHRFWFEIGEQGIRIIRIEDLGIYEG